MSRLTLALLIATGALLGGCWGEPKTHLTSEYQDDKTCRSFVKNKNKDDDTTYEECRRSLVDMANMPLAAPPRPNVTVIINQ